MSYPIPDPRQRPPLHAELDEPGPPPPHITTPARARHAAPRVVGGANLLALIPPPRSPGEVDRRRDDGRACAIADRAAREAYAAWAAAPRISGAYAEATSAASGV